MNQVAEKKEGALAANLFEADANQGAQNISQEDLALPFLKVLGQLSPEVNKRDGKYVEGAEPGKIINTVTNLPVILGQGSPVSHHLEAASSIDCSFSEVFMNEKRSDSVRWSGPPRSPISVAIK